MKWAPHKSRQLKGDRGITYIQSKELLNLTNQLVPIGSRKLPIAEYTLLYCCISSKIVLCRNLYGDVASSRLSLTMTHGLKTKSLDLLMQVL